MPLLAGHIRFARSVNMADVPEGGGPPSSQLLTSGRSNDIFPDLSEETRTVGRVEIYQIFSVLRNSDRTPLLGGNVILAEPPADPNVSITLLSLKNPFATRADIAKRAEAGMSPGSEWSGYLLEDHYATMRSMTVLQRPGMPPPTIARSYLLIFNEGLSSERRQRVRIKNTTVEQRTFTEIVNNQLIDFQAQVTMCELFDGLLYDYPGSPPSRFFARNNSKTKIRETVYSDSGMFYGASPLVQATAINDVWLKVASIYTQVVPNSRTEVAAIDQYPSARKTVLLAETPRRIEVGVTPHTQRIRITEENVGFTYVALLKPLPAPGTLFIDYWSMGNRYTITDDGTGKLTGQGSGSVSQLSGALTMTLKSLPDVGSSITISHGEKTAYTNRSSQGAQVRQPEYAFTLQQDGAVPGTISMTWPSGGVLRTVTDNGSGQWTGDGTGEVDYPSSSVRLRTPHLIDAGGQFQISYQRADMAEELFTGVAVDAAGFATITTAQQPLAGSVQVQWVTAQEVSNTSGGALTEASTKTELEHQTEQVFGLKNWGNWSKGSDGKPVWQRWGAGDASDPSLYGWMTHVLSTDNKKTSLLRSTVKDETSATRTVTASTMTDDGAGGFLSGMGSVLYASKTISAKLITHNRSTESYKSDHEDASSFEQDGDSTTPSGSNSNKGGEYSTTAVGEQLLGNVLVRYQVGPLAPSSVTETYTPPVLAIDLCPYTSDTIVPGSLQFQWMGETYQDFEGRLYRGRSSTTTGFDSGSVNYTSAMALLEDYTVAPGGFVLQSLWTRRIPWTTASLFFHVDTAPIRAGAGGFVLTCTDTQGTNLTANIDAQGNITGLHMRGRVEFSRGGVELQFGDYVLDTSLTDEQKAEWWYSADNVGAVEAGKIWRPWPIDPTTLRYSAVSYIYLPVDVSLMGIDPAALPADGRVAFARPGDTCVIGVTHSAPAFAPMVGQTYDVGHERLSFVQVQNASTGAEIQTGYTADLDAGTVTFTDLTDYPAQVRVVGRTEVYRQIAEVRIDGSVKLTQPIGYAFDTDAIFSTALRQGDRFARVSRVYDQFSWTGTVWVDGLDPEKGPATGTYNTGSYPVEVTNLGAITERWGLRIKADGTTFDCIGQHLGQIASGNINQDFSPINPASGAPYFTLRAAGWGSGWVAGNTVFIDTIGAEFQIACVRCTQPGSPAGPSDSAWLVQRGDVGAPPESEF